jgi:hypothetical protein
MNELQSDFDGDQSPGHDPHPGCSIKSQAISLVTAMPGSSRIARILPGPDAWG